MVQEHADQILLTDVQGTEVRTSLTGGSTGEPLTTYIDAKAPLIAMSWRMYRWWGIEPGTTWRTSAGCPGEARPGRSWRPGSTWWPTKLIHVDATYLEPAAIGKFIDSINRQKPRMVEGFVGALLEVAAFAQRHGLTMPSPCARRHGVPAHARGPGVPGVRVGRSGVRPVPLR